MGAIKPALVLHYMQHYSLSKISLSDTDTVWLRNPQGKSSQVLPLYLFSYMRAAFVSVSLLVPDGKRALTWYLDDCRHHGC